MPKPINVSASRGAAILGLSKWRTPVQVWLEIMEDLEPGFCDKNNYELQVVEDNASIRWGRAFEDEIIELAIRKNNLSIFDREKFFEKEYLTCHIDGKYDLYNWLHEGKTTTQYYFQDNFGEPGTDQVPIEYQIQCQHQMLCTGAEKVILSVLVFPIRPDDMEKNGVIINSNKAKLLDIPFRWANVLDQMGCFHQYEIKAHPELHKLMFKHYTEFWENNVLKKMPPEPKTYSDIKALMREPAGTIIADENIINLMVEYKQIKEEISGTGSLGRRAEEIKVNVLKWINDQEKVADHDSADKWIVRNQAGKKIATYGKNKNGQFYFR